MVRIAEENFRFGASELEQAHVCFKEFGFALVENIIPQVDIVCLTNRIRSFYQELLKKESLKTESLSLDQLYFGAKKEFPEHAPHFMNIVRDFPEFHQFISNKALLKISEFFLKTKAIQSVFDTSAMRIDEPNPKPSLEWHQDYPFNMMADDTITYWIPIQDIGIEHGPVYFVPKSHNKILPINYSKKKKENHYETNYISIKNIEQHEISFKRNEFTFRNGIDAGSVLLINSKVVHRSGQNYSKIPRWVAICRHGSLFNQNLVDRKWYTFRSKYPDLFVNIHPDLVTVTD